MKNTKSSPKISDRVMLGAAFIIPGILLHNNYYGDKVDKILDSNNTEVGNIVASNFSGNIPEIRMDVLHKYAKVLPAQDGGTPIPNESFQSPDDLIHRRRYFS